jgi:HK97 family phage prohead protease
MFTEIRTYPLELREVNDEGTFVGHFSVFDVIDSYNSTFDRGAFVRTIKARKGEFPLAKNHQWESPFGMARGVEEDETGVLIKEGRINMRSTVGQEVYVGLPHRDNPASGYYSDMSHAFDTVRAKVDKDGVEHKQEVKVFEISIVTRNFGSNPEAGIEQVRAATDSLRRLNSALKEGNEQRFMEEVTRLRSILETVNVPNLGEEDIETASTLVRAEGSSMDTRRLQDSLDYLKHVIANTAKG